MKTELERLYSINEAAEYLRVSRWTVWAKLSKGELRRTKIGGPRGRTVIRESELVRILKDATTSQTTSRLGGSQQEDC